MNKNGVIHKTKRQERKNEPKISIISRKYARIMQKTSNKFNVDNFVDNSVESCYKCKKTVFRQQKGTPNRVGRGKGKREKRSGN